MPSQECQIATRSPITGLPSYVPPPNPYLPLEETIESTTSLPFHTYRPNGLLSVNTDASHPVYELIEKAQEDWRLKLNRASQTLDEAIAEYRRRYNRAPPKGFGAWWEYVQEHNVQLPDEYDQIARDIEPFWGYHPLDLQQIQAEQESHTDSYTFGKTIGSEIRLMNFSFVPEPGPNVLRGAEDILALLKDVQQHIPPFRAVFSPHDNPILLSDYDIKKKFTDAAATGSYVDLDGLPEPQQDGWISACSPSSPAREASSGSFSDDVPSKSFIYDPRKTMDPCLHPMLLDIHGEFLSHDHGSSPQKRMLPQFAYCSTLIHHDIQYPSLLSWVDDINPRSDDPEWDKKLDERLSWRGSNTGMWHASDTRWREAQRARLVTYSNDLNGTARVLIPPTRKHDPVGDGINVSKSKINPAMMDIAFAGSPLGCPSDYCKELETMFDWRKRQNAKEAGNFRYVIDIDGNAWSSRFKRLITSNSLIFKATIYPEWFLDRIQPWLHYVPVQIDLSDLYDSFIFFHGGMYGEGANVELAAKIAREGREWSKSFWRKQDMTAYLFRLMLEYARVTSLDRDDMSYEQI
ncbi:glycosyl transferase family 90-domain-containing protein [Crucibulum laeve]|uniref:Glycosyl transferase family 90-domain-containing protein n=1 Tax=Crucibulum laeve TaxID=68775 RepID=A0A5C3LN70_9AGAR|nr:glycosyl transferase family 90-domain-containing protein [Crucibulum laeve]